MAVTTFAAIDIGSYYVNMEIFEISPKSGLKSLNRVRQNVETGRDTYALHRITMERTNELTAILTDFKRIMKEYGVQAYRACAKSAFREAANEYLVLDQIYRVTGINVDVLSNSEQRFLGYKSIASRGEEFQNFIEKGTAIVDVGGGSIQISLFENDNLVTTQNILLGSLRIRERIGSFERDTIHYDMLVDQLIRKDLINFRRMYMKNRKIESIILVGDYFTNLIFANRSKSSNTETREEFMRWYEHVVSTPQKVVAAELGISQEMSTVLIPMAVLYRKLIEVLKVETIWLPGIQLTDGIAYDYALGKKLIQTTHNFDKDIVMAAKNIARRYASNKAHNDALVRNAEAIFDVVRKPSRMAPRDKLLLTVACYLHDCGKYISLVNVAECCYNIIMSTEIIGLSERERCIIANVVRYNTQELGHYKAVNRPEELSVEDHVMVARLVAIMRIANCLDQSYLQKIETLSVSKKENELVITVGTNEDFTLERGVFQENVNFFKEIFNLKPILKMKGRR